MPLRCLSLLVLTILAGCSLFDEGIFDDGIAEPVEGSVVFSLPVLDLDGEGPEPEQRYLDVWTEKIYSCLLPLAVDFGRDGSDLRLKVLGIAEVDACPTALGPASARLPITLPGGTYSLELTNLGQTDVYRVTVEGAAVTVEAQRSEVSRYAEPGEGWPF